MCYRQGKSSEAAVYARKAIGLKGKLPQGYNCLGMALGQQGKLAEAIDELNKSIQIKPNFYVGYFNLGNAFEGKGKSRKR